MAEVTKESVLNFRIATIGDDLTEILDIQKGNVHLALVKPRGDSPEITGERWSPLGGRKIAPLDNNGAHTGMAFEAGISGAISAPLAIGFTIKKTAVNSYQMASPCWALNYPFDLKDYPRPEGNLLEKIPDWTPLRQ